MGHGHRATFTEGVLAVQYALDARAVRLLVGGHRDLAPTTTNGDGHDLVAESAGLDGGPGALERGGGVLIPLRKPCASAQSAA